MVLSDVPGAYDLLRWLGLSEGLSLFGAALIAVIVLITFVLVSAIYFIWLERKVAVPVIVAGSMNLNVIGQNQTGFIYNWYLFNDPFTFAAFWTYFVCATAQCKRAPFDLAEAESELVAGFHTEYSGLRWSFFFMAEYASLFAVSGIATLLFLGGWNTGLVPWYDLTDLFGSPWN